MLEPLTDAILTTWARCSSGCGRASCTSPRTRRWRSCIWPARKCHAGPAGASAYGPPTGTPRYLRAGRHDLPTPALRLRPPHSRRRGHLHQLRLRPAGCGRHPYRRPLPDRTAGHLDDGDASPGTATSLSRLGIGGADHAARQRLAGCRGDRAARGDHRG